MPVFTLEQANSPANEAQTEPGLGAEAAPSTVDRDFALREMGEMERLAFGPVEPHEDIFSAGPGEYLARDGDAKLYGSHNVFLAGQDRIHTDETHVADNLHLQQLALGNTPPTSDPDAFYTRIIDRQQASLEHAIRELSSAGTADERLDSFENLKSRYISSVARDQEHAGRLEEAFGHMEDALLSDSPVIRKAAANELRAFEDELEVPAAMLAALDSTGNVRIENFTKDLLDCVKVDFEAKRARGENSPEEAVHAELTRSNAALAAEIVNQSSEPLADDVRDQLRSLLNSGRPDAIVTASTLLETEAPSLAEEMKMVQLQQSFLDAKYGPDKTEATAELARQVSQTHGMPVAPDEALSTAAELLQPQVVKEVLGSHGENQQSVNQIVGEYQTMPLKERVQELATVLTEINSTGMDNEKLIKRLIDVYGGLDVEEAAELNEEYRRITGSRLYPNEVIDGRLMALEPRAYYTAEQIMTGVNTTEVAALVAEGIYLDSGFGGAYRATKEALLDNRAVDGVVDYVFGDDLYPDDQVELLLSSLSIDQRSEVLEHLKPHMIAIDSKNPPSPFEVIQEYLPDATAPAHGLKQSIPGVSEAARIGPQSQYGLFNQRFRDLLDKNPTLDQIHALLDRAPDSDSVSLLAYDNPALFTRLGQLLPAADAENVIRRISKLPATFNLQDLEENLTYSPAHPNRIEAFQNMMLDLDSGPRGELQFKAIQELYRAKTGASLEEAIAAYASADSSMTAETRIDLDLLARGAAPERVAQQLLEGKKSIKGMLDQQEDLAKELESTLPASLSALEKQEQLENFKTRLALRIGSAFKSAHPEGKAITSLFPAAEPARTKVFTSFYGQDLARDILDPVQRTDSILSSKEPGLNVDAALGENLERLKETVSEYDTQIAAETDSSQKVLLLDARAALVTGFSNSLEATFNTPVEDLFNSAVSTQSFATEHAAILGRLGITITPRNSQQTGTETDEALRALSFDPQAIAADIHSGSYTFDKINEARTALAGKDMEAGRTGADALSTQFGFRVADAYRQQYGAELPYEKIRGVDDGNKPGVFGTFSGSQYAQSVDMHVQEIAALLSMPDLPNADSLSNEDIAGHLERIPNQEHFAEQYRYLTGRQLTDDLKAASPDTAELRSSHQQTVDRLGLTF